MPANHEKLGPIHQKILALLKDAPQGLTIYEIRDRIPEMGVQQHLDRRVRELRYYYDIPRKNGRYFYQGIRAAPVADSGEINAKLRAEVLTERTAVAKCAAVPFPKTGSSYKSIIRFREIGAAKRSLKTSGRFANCAITESVTSFPASTPMKCAEWWRTIASTNGSPNCCICTWASQFLHGS
jgi:hypothetical protein